LKLPEITAKLCEILEGLDPDDRRKVVGAALTLLGTPQGPGAGLLLDEIAATDLAVGNNARRWMQQNHISVNTLQEIFHIGAGVAEVIASDVPGSSKRAKTKSCYLLSGIRALLADDQPNFSESDAVELCRHVACYDSPNHANTRKDLGNQIRGTKDAGYSLSAPGLRAAAELIKSMAAA
jgi:hypothetical protein